MDLIRLAFMIQKDHKEAYHIKWKYQKYLKKTNSIEGGGRGPIQL